MATIRQKKAAEKVKEVIEKNLDISGGDVLKSVGYGTGLQIQPGRVFKSEGFKEAIKDLGFSLDAADMTVAKILRTGREENQLKASDQIYKRLGGYTQQEGQTNNNFFFVVPKEAIERHDRSTDPSPSTDR